MAADKDLIEALTPLWNRPPQRNKLSHERSLLELKRYCARRYGSPEDNPIFDLNLNTALKSLGCPSLPALCQSELPVNLLAAAEAIDQAFARTTMRRHICPLDLAENLPLIEFGSAKIAKFTEKELECLFDAPRLARFFPKHSLETDRFSQFYWLIVEEKIPENSNQCFGIINIEDIKTEEELAEIHPLNCLLPKIIEETLFFLLLSPWEDWSLRPKIDWRGFRIPWIYTLDENLFIHPNPPPNPESLTWEREVLTDSSGEDNLICYPRTLPLDECKMNKNPLFTNEAWNKTQEALKTPLFETPIVHFLVHAFLCDGIDEFMAHMTAIEAALGLESDYNRRNRNKNDPRKNMFGTKCIAPRVGAILKEADLAEKYETLFDRRSEYIHGRAKINAIPSDLRNTARIIARRVVSDLVEKASSAQLSREEFLNNLLV
ncbi:hypothetical protein [Rhodospirillum rubrum]|uniref:hypothetical protein n=1 Tax=Rhodospirillum rubrum TaxID=1085 RepID=UPI001906BB3F|nr:hypothetical protein [Rhodospirillum rubrum]